MLVPESRWYWVPSLERSPSADSTETPGATRSGFSSSAKSESPSSARGPRLLEEATASSPLPGVPASSSEPTAMTPAPPAGEGIWPVSPSFPTEATTTMPSSAARLASTAAMSWPSL